MEDFEQDNFRVQWAGTGSRGSGGVSTRPMSDESRDPEFVYHLLCCSFAAILNERAREQPENT